MKVALTSARGVPDSKGLKLRFCRRWLDIGKNICKQGWPSFYFSKIHMIAVSGKGEAEKSNLASKSTLCIDAASRVH
jgi:hypothetical protein